MTEVDTLPSIRLSIPRYALTAAERDTVAACLVFALVGLLLRASPWGAAAAAVVSTILTVVITGANRTQPPCACTQ